MKSLQQQMLQPFMQGMKQSLEGMSADDLKRMREMMRDLNRMLRQRADGEEPDFDAFKAKWGQNFPGVESLDELLEQLGRQAAQLQSLMDSMSPGQRRQLQEMMSSLFMKDERLEAEMAQLAMNLDQLGLTEEFRRRYDFRGDDELTMREAMKLMDELQQMEELERQPAASRHRTIWRDRPHRRREAARRGVGARPGAAQGAREEAGGGRLPRAQGRPARADRARHPQARRQGPARHLRAPQARPLRPARRGASRRGRRPYRRGQALRVRRSVPARSQGNADERGRAQRRGHPVRLSPDDFEVFRTELSTQASTVVMLDMSRSMINNGYFLPAKKVALALTALIRGQFPRDSLYILGFSLYARVQGRGLAEARVDRVEHRDQHAPRLPALAAAPGRQKGGNKQIIMITDGEPPPMGEPRGRLLLPADPPHVRGDAEGSAALHARGHHHQHVHARAEPDAPTSSSSS